MAFNGKGLAVSGLAGLQRQGDVAESKAGTGQQRPAQQRSIHIESKQTTGDCDISKLFFLSFSISLSLSQ